MNIFDLVKPALDELISCLIDVILKPLRNFLLKYFKWYQKEIKGTIRE